MIVVYYLDQVSSFEPSFSRSIGVEPSNTPLLTQFIFTYKRRWAHVGIVFLISFALQAVIPSWVLRSPLVVILGGLLFFIVLVFAFLGCRDVLGSFMWPTILADDQGDRFLVSRPEFELKDTGAEAGKEDCTVAKA